MAGEDVVGLDRGIDLSAEEDGGQIGVRRRQVRSAARVPRRLAIATASSNRPCRRAMSASTAIPGIITSPKSDRLSGNLSQAAPESVRKSRIKASLSSSRPVLKA